jgi:hypothetical protein
MGLALPQSPLSRHWTQDEVPAKHRGSPAGQSESRAHSTQSWVVVSQIFPTPLEAQSFAVWQPTQTPGPGPVWQSGRAFGQSESAEHEAWHWWSPGQHDGAASRQSELVPHAAHLPVATTQMGSGCAQLSLDRHATHPSVGLHCWPPGHWLLPLTPQSALPAPRDEPLLPLQAMNAARTTSAIKPQDFAL